MSCTGQLPSTCRSAGHELQHWTFWLCFAGMQMDADAQLLGGRGVYKVMLGKSEFEVRAPQVERAT